MAQRPVRSLVGPFGRWRMTRERYQAKGVRLLAEGRVSILEVVPSTSVLATVRGDSAAVYVVRFDAGSWWCTCPAASRCSHVFAVQRCTVVDLPQEVGT